MNVLRTLRTTRNLHQLSMFHSVTAGSKPIEEETLLHYSPLSFYPVHIGQIFQERYEVKVKIGFGGSSTVWLCQDKKDNTNRALKVGTYSTAESRESKVLTYLESCRSSHDGRYCVRRSCDSFTIKVRSGAHQCLVYEPLGMSLLDYVNRQPDKRLSMKAVAWIATYLLTGLDYLHTCRVVHTDIKLDNILTTLPVDEDAILTDMINAEHENPSPRKVVDEKRTIYSSRIPECGNDLTYPIICDFGMAVFGRDEYEGPIQPVPYRAPEVILGMKWSFSADIWNLGLLIWELLFSEHLFGSNTEQECLGMMIAYLGTPPRQFLERKTLPSLYFDENGGWKGNYVKPVALHDRLEGVDIELFLDFIRSMLRWIPEERGTAETLLKHPWLIPK